MTAFIGAVSLVIGVTALMKAFALGPRALHALRTSRSALAAMTDPTRGDDQKAAVLQGYSLALLRSCVDLVIRGVGAIAIPLGLLWTFECAGLLSLSAVLALMRSWVFLLVGSIAALAAFWPVER
jgi:hypothetical protein